MFLCSVNQSIKLTWGNGSDLPGLSFLISFKTRVQTQLVKRSKGQPSLSKYQMVPELGSVLRVSQNPFPSWGGGGEGGESLTTRVLLLLPLFTDLQLGIFCLLGVSVPARTPAGSRKHSCGFKWTHRTWEILGEILDIGGASFLLKKTHNDF